MTQDYKLKQIKSIYDSCNKCGLPLVNCICDKAPKIKTVTNIWILSTEREFYRPSNTARLLELTNPNSTEIFCWERTNKPEKLIEKINDHRYETFLVFPDESKELKNRKVEYKNTGKIPAFILIDGTWKEARKIIRRSDYLKELPLISLNPSSKSEYDLRRGANEKNLCTIEAAMEVLKITREIENSEVIEEFYKVFLDHYKTGGNAIRR